MQEERLPFQAEVNQLLDLVIHSLYSHNEIFLRELISNATDAIDKLRYESLTDDAMLEEGGEWAIRLIPDRDAGTLTVRDNGIGMTREEVVRELGTIAQSGTREFIRHLREQQKPSVQDLIGQFGVGFYASFMVADRVVVESRRAGAPAASGVRWESEAKGGFTVREVEKPSRGTDVVLHLKEEAKHFLNEWEIRQVVRKYSDFIEHPILMDVERERESESDKSKKVKVREEETLNTRKALWLREKSELSESDYSEFYKHLTRDFSDPARVVHFKAEGTSEFTCLLFIPSRRPIDLFFNEMKTGPVLYVRRVQIMDHCEALIPKYLRFVRGVVDSADIPLNVSREMLQSNKHVEVIQNSIVKKVLDSLAEMKQQEKEKYRSFHGEFGDVLKEGVHTDFNRREAVAKLLLFDSSAAPGGDPVDLDAYVDRMKQGQGEIYYMIGANREELMKSPYLETFVSKGTEVLFLKSEIDDIIFGDMEFRGKKFRSVQKGDVSLEPSETEERKRSGERFKRLLQRFQDLLKDDVKEVRLSGRLTGSPCCLVTGEGEMDPKMEKIFRSMGRDAPATKRVLELNPSHPLLAAMDRALEAGGRDEALDSSIRILYDQALVVEGSRPKDTGAFARSVADLLALRLAGDGPGKGASDRL